MTGKLYPAAFILLVAALAIITSCAPGGDEAGADTGVTAPQTSENITERLYPELPDEDFGGYAFRVLTKGTYNVHWQTRDIFAEGETGDTINDAVYRRNVAIEDKYGFRIEELGEQDFTAALKRSVLARDDAYDMVSISFIPLSEDNLLYNLYDIEYMDLEAPWYDQNANASLAIHGRLFQTTGDLVVMDNDATWGVLFNKQIAQDKGIGSLYESVKNGEWTGEMMLSDAKLGAVDLNGDGKMHELDDQWGVIGSGFNSIALAAGAGEHIIEKDGDGNPVISLFTEKYLNCFETAYKMHVDNGFCLYAEDYISKYADPWTNCIEKAFSDGRALFNFSGINRVTLFRSMEVDFGILPVPKYDEAQEKYYSIVSTGSASSIGIPSTVTDTDRTGIIIEALSAESMYTLTPAYYDVSLKTKYVRDSESSDMLDIIFANRVFDLGLVYNWGQISTAVDRLMTTRNESFTPALEAIREKTESAIAKTMEIIGN